jgi:tripartite-type tricarboxylate transporter receptor subunit TctC
MKFSVTFFLGLSALAAGLPNMGPAFAAQPSVTTLVVPYSTGSGIDTVSRIIAPRLSELLARPVLVDNKSGASGNIGADFVAKSRPDGSVLMVTVNSFNVTPALYKKLPYDPNADFTPISKVGVSLLALVVNSNLQVKNFEEFKALMSAKPGAFNYSSSGAGTAQHLAMEVLKKRFGLDIVHVPYKGASGAMADVLGGQTQMMMMPVHNAMPFVRSGKINMIAIAGDTRSTYAPQVPSLLELGAGSLDLVVTFWVSGPAGMPAELVNTLNADLKLILSSNDVKDQLHVQGILPEVSTPGELREFIRKDIDRWKTFVKEQNLTFEP